MLFLVRCSLLVVRRSLFVDSCCSLFVVCCSLLFVVCNVLVVVLCVDFVVCGPSLLLVVRC